MPPTRVTTRTWRTPPWPRPTRVRRALRHLELTPGPTHRRLRPPS